MGPIGVQEMIAIFVVALILFGPKKLPELARTLGKALSEFRRAKNELKATFETHLHELERETRISTSPTSSDYSPVRYPYPYEDYGKSEDYLSAAPYEAEPSVTRAVTPAAMPAIEAPQPEIEPESEAPQQHSASYSEPVAGTVARSSGIYSGDAIPASADKERSA
ncbi:MAG: twin-arginine translocase TatA/TatE family subunit [Acidobacteriaceae bacterium]|nr:twin-arginine translocase TatA/TatE family subunit [Acidobacteriaceae bacterium]